MDIKSESIKTGCVTIRVCFNQAIARH